MLKGVKLDSSYWSHALRHAVYIKNRLPHSALPGHITPFHRFTGRQPDLTHLKVFGSHVTVKQPRVRRSKLDTSFTTTGIFLGFTATDRTIWFEDAIENRHATPRHAIFNEAHYTPNNHPSYAQELMNLAEEDLTKPSPPTPSSSLPTHLIPDFDTPLPPPSQKISHFRYFATANTSTSPTSYCYTRRYRHTLTPLTPEWPHTPHYSGGRYNPHTHCTHHIVTEARGVHPIIQPIWSLSRYLTPNQGNPSNTRSLTRKSFR